MPVLLFFGATAPGAIWRSSTVGSAACDAHFCSTAVGAAAPKFSITVASSAAERVPELGGGGVTRVARLLERAHDDRLELRRDLDVGIDRDDRRRLLGHVFEDVAVRVGRLERRLAGEHLVHDDAEGVEVGARVE